MYSHVSRFTSGWLNELFPAKEENSDIALSNISTGVILPDGVADRLINASKTGRSSMRHFIKSRLGTNEGSFWDPLTTLKMRTSVLQKRRYL